MIDRLPDISLALVVDGGGTKTACQVLNTSRGKVVVLGTGATTGSNPATVGIDAATGAIHEAIRQARVAAGLDESVRFERGALAIAGTVDEHVRAKLESSVAALSLSNQCRVFPDVLPPVLAASLTGPAAALVAGTGTVAVLRKADGGYGLAGGWGYLLGDDGSGYAIGRAALRATLGQLEAGEATSPLVQSVLQELDATTTTDVKHAIYQNPQPRPAIAALARLVLDLGDLDDPMADSIVEAAASDLVALLQRGLARFAPNTGEVPLMASGGLFQAGSAMRAKFEAVLKARGIQQARYLEHPLTAAQLLLRDDIYAAPIVFTT
jgi:glucosamine kinase